MRADAGVVISASHNPYEDNGIKLFGRDGFKLDDALELRIEDLLASNTLDARPITGSGIGSATRVDDAGGRYVVYCKTTFPEHLTLDGIRVVVDAAHGAAYKVAPAVFAELGADVVPLGVKPTGRNINKTGALHPQAMAREVLRRRAQLGVALDGDADRVIVVDEKGERVDGDTIMALCASRMLKKRLLPKKTLVATVMSNLGLEQAMTRMGGKLVRTAVGDRYVVERMRRGGYGLGGEQSGHLIFMNHATTGDGIVAALQLLATCIEENKPLSELAGAALTRVPQVLVSQSFSERLPLQEMAATTRVMKRVEKKLGKRGRVVVRWSGTEPKLRVMVEGPREKAITEHAESILAAAQRDIPAH